MPPLDFDINRLIEKLDEVAIKYEAKWGVYRLETLASPDLARKWQAQVDKINEAIETKNIRSLEDLVEGAIRGYALLEAEAIKGGHSPTAPEFWELRKGSRVYRVVMNTMDARAMQKPENSDVTILTLEEVVNLYDAKARMVYGEPEKVATPGELTGFDYDKGDPIPFD